MIGILLLKDLRRAWRNPLPYAVHLIIPLCLTALVGLAFGGRSEREILGRIRIAVVDEDRSYLTSLLRGILNHREASSHVEPVFLEREEAMRLVGDNKISGVLILPQDMTTHYLTGNRTVTLQWIKNPAQAWQPAVVEEALGVLVTGLNAAHQVLGPELANWHSIFDGQEDYHRAAQLVVQTGDRLKSLAKYLNPPLIGAGEGEFLTASTEKSPPTAEASPPAAEAAPKFNLFSYILVGMMAMFLLFIAGNAMIDLLREERQGTLLRYNTLHHSLLGFVISKVCFTWVLLLLGSAIMLGGGGLIFHMAWRRPEIMLLLVASYCLFAAGLMGWIISWMKREERATTAFNLAGMALGLAGGCAFPAELLPGFLRHYVTPFLPPAWFLESVRLLELGQPPGPWITKCVLMGGMGLCFALLAARLFRRRFEQGGRG